MRAFFYSATRDLYVDARFSLLLLPRNVRAVSRLTGGACELRDAAGDAHRKQL